MSQKKYKLYALPDKPECRELTAKERFQYVRPGKYILFYTADGQPNAVAIEKENLKRLNRSELEWLLACGDTLTAEWMKENETTVAETAGDFLNEFQRELEAEREKISMEAG